MLLGNDVASTAMMATIMTMMTTLTTVILIIAEEKKMFLLAVLDITEDVHFDHQRNTNSTTKIPIIVPIIIIPPKLAPSQ